MPKSGRTTSGRGNATTMPSNAAGFMPVHGATYLILTGDKGNELLRINMRNGKMTFGPEYSPDQAAMTFWNAVNREYQEFLAWKKSDERR